jgi:hypothetical protein
MAMRNMTAAEIDKAYSEWEKERLDKGRYAGRRDGLMEAVEALCSALDIKMTKKRRRELMQLNVTELGLLISDLESTRRWPTADIEMLCTLAWFSAKKENDIIDKGHQEGRHESLRRGIRALCCIFDIELSIERRRALASRRVPELKALLTELETTRRWPTE